MYDYVKVNCLRVFLLSVKVLERAECRACGKAVFCASICPRLVSRYDTMSAVRGIERIHFCKDRYSFLWSSAETSQNCYSCIVRCCLDEHKYPFSVKLESYFGQSLNAGNNTAHKCGYAGLCTFLFTQTHKLIVDDCKQSSTRDTGFYCTHKIREVVLSSSSSCSVTRSC